jgi:AcrR family transcriptional regulator
VVIQPPAAQRRANRAQARERILDAAVATFAEQGYEGASLARIAETVGLSQPGVLHHFGSKRALLMAVLQRRDEVDRNEFEVHRAEGLRALDHLVQLMDVNATIPGMIRSFSAVTGEAVAEQHPAREYFHRRYDRIRTDLADALDRGIASGEIRPDVDCTQIAAEIFALMDGLQIQWLHDPATVDMVEIFKNYIARLQRDLATSPPPPPSQA